MAENTAKASVLPQSLGLLSNREVAEALGVTCRSVRNYVKRGLLQPYRIRSSNRLRFKTEDVLKLLEPVEAG
jgi:excisionase family DNA binding protein